MKTVVTTPAVDISLRALENASRRRVLAWFDRLANWDGDAFVRQNSRRLDSIPDTYVLQTKGQLRIFFELHGDTIKVVDIASRRSILMFGHAPENE
jgi:hypothetical protein